MLRVWIMGCFVISFHSSAQVRGYSFSAAGIGAYTLHQVDVFAGASHQASLAQLKNTQAGIYGERKFLLGELNDLHAALGFVTAAGNFGLQLNYYGFSAYRQTSIGLAHARKLYTKVDIGVQFNYNNINLGTYGSATSISAAGGAILHITEKLHTGFHITYPVSITFGAGYEPSDLFFISTEIIKEENKPIQVDVALHYQLLPQLHIRTGITTATSSFWISAGFTWKKMRLDMTNSFHPQLGITPSLAMLFTFPKKNNDEKVVADNKL